MNPRDGEDPNAHAALLIATVTVCAISLPALVVGVILGRLMRSRRGWLSVAALAGGGVTALLYGSIMGEMQSAWDASLARRHFKLEAIPGTVWPYMSSWWIQAIGLAPAIGLLVEAFRGSTVEEQHQRAERRERGNRERREERARRAVGTQVPERRPAGFELGRHVDGDRLLAVRRGRAVLPLARLEKTTLVVGAPGSGKTETLLRLAQGVAATERWRCSSLTRRAIPAPCAASKPS